MTAPLKRAGADTSRRAALSAHLRILGAELGAATDAVAVWRALYRYARATTATDSMIVALYDPGRQERECVYLAEGEREEDVAGLPPMPLNDTAQSRAIVTEQPVLTDDLDATLAGLPEVHVGMDQAPELTRSSIAVPMRARAVTIGVVELQSYQPAAFPPRDAPRLWLAAAMAALASDNFRLPSSTRRRAAKRTARQCITAIIDEQAFAPVYQPIVEIATMRVIGYEALSRFSDGSPPDQHFAAAAEAGLGLELEAATLRAALRGAQVLALDAWLALNVSPRMILGHQPLHDLVKAEPRAIVLEITEHSAIGDYTLFQHALHRLPPAIDLAIDDAGAGYASFRHILELRPKFVKLSDTFIRRIDADPALQALVRGLAAFALESGSVLVAEGIETDEELRTAHALGIALGQGYLLGRPSPAAAWAATL